MRRYHHSSRYRRPRAGIRFMKRREPGFWNTLLFHLRGIPNTLTFARFHMNTSNLQPTSRRNALIRAVATVCGDIAVGAALASTCVWIIETAALGLFLSFLIWLIGAVLALAVSQFVIHPAAAVLLSDRKLDQAVDALSGACSSLTGVVSQVGADLGSSLLASLRSSSLVNRFRSARGSV